MAYSDKYERQFDYFSYQNANPTRPLPGDKINIEFNYLVNSISQLVDFMKVALDSSGKIKGGSITTTMLSPAVRSLMGDVDAFDEQYQNLVDAVASASTSATSASTSATAAAASATSASGSASSASTSASNAAASAEIAALPHSILSVVVEGDSISKHNDATSWGAKMLTLDEAFAETVYYNVAENGDNAVNMASTYTAQVHPYAPSASDPASRHLFMLFAGGNDIQGGSTAATTYNALKSLWAAARADGFTVIAFTVMNRITFTGDSATQWAALNNLILSDTSLYDRLVRADLVLQDPSNVTYFAGGIHPTPAGYARIAEAARRVAAERSSGAVNVSPRGITETLLGSPNIPGDDVGAHLVTGSGNFGAFDPEQLSVQSNTDAGQDVGAGINFGGRFISGSAVATGFGAIRGVKENSSSGNFAGALDLYARQNGGAYIKGLRIQSNGKLLTPYQLSGIWVSDGGGNISNVESVRGDGGLRSGPYYFSSFGAAWAGSANAAVAANTLYAMPFNVGTAQVFTKIGIYVSVLAAGGNCRLGIYQWSAGKPTNLILDCGTVSVATTGAKEATISAVLPVGSYALVALFDSTPAIATASPGLSLGHSAPGTPYLNITATCTYGSLPSSFSAVGVGTLTFGTGANTMPSMWMRV